MWIVPLTGSSTGVWSLAMLCADHQGEVRNMADICNVALAGGSSGGATCPDGPWWEWDHGGMMEQVPGQGRCEWGPIAPLITPQTATSSSSRERSHHPASRHWRRQADLDDSDGGVGTGIRGHRCCPGSRGHLEPALPCQTLRFPSLATPTDCTCAWISCTSPLVFI